MPAAARPITAAAMASILSSELIVLISVITGAGRGAAGAGAMAGREAAAAAVGAAVARGAAGAGAACAAAGAAAADGAGPAAAPGGRVGNFIVGAADGFGGKLIRTVSFLGWTLPVSFLGGTAPLGTLGMFSAINVNLTSA